MPFVPTPNGIKAEMRYTFMGERAENVFWFLSPNPAPTITELAGVANYLFGWWDASVKTIQSSNAFLREIYVTDQSAIDGESVTFVPDEPAQGANVQEPLPGNVTLCISLRTAKRGRSYRGRSYVIGLTENQVLLNNLTEVAAAAWLAAWDNLISGAAVAGAQLAIASFRNGGSPRAQGVLTPVNDAVIVDTVVDSMRRRLPGRGQ